MNIYLFPREKSCTLYAVRLEIIYKSDAYLKNDNTKLVDGGIEAQTHQVMKNLLEVLNAAGSSLEKVIFARVYLVNFVFDKMNSVYASYFAKDKLPARTCIGVTGLAVGASVEIDFIAAC